MRTTSSIDALLSSTRRDILAATFMAPARWWYLSDLARRLGRPRSSLQRDLAALTAADILRRKRDGNRVYFRANEECPFFPELRGLILKTVGLVEVLREALEPVRPRIHVAAAYGSIARAEERAESDVDLLVVGDATLKELTPLLAEAEEHLGRPVNVSRYSVPEFRQKLRARHHFLRSVLDSELLFIVGSADDLESAAQPRRPGPPKPKQAGTR